MKVRFTPQAETDLLDIGDFIAQDAPRRALSFVRELREACTALRAFPRRCPVEVEAAGMTIRRLSHDRYNVFYAVEGHDLVVLRILEGSCNRRHLLGLHRLPDGAD